MSTRESISVPVTVSTSPAYSAGDSIGGLITISNALNRHGAGILRQLTVVDLDNHTLTGVFIFFSANPSGSTLTDNAAVSIAAADISKVIDVYAISSGGSYSEMSSGIQTFTVTPNVYLQAASSTLYMAIKSIGTPTFTGAANLKILMTIERP